MTVIDPVPLSAEGQARAWLEELDRERDVADAVAIVNRVVQMHRIAAADPYVREVSAAQALVIRAGWGEGEQVAYGQWLHARELGTRPRRRGARRRATAAGRCARRSASRRCSAGAARALLCEELDAARAPRPRPGPPGPRRGRAGARAERGGRRSWAPRNVRTLRCAIAELEQLRERVAEQASKALAAAAARAAAGGENGLERARSDEELLEHALGRLEAALRARTASGV